MLSAIALATLAAWMPSGSIVDRNAQFTFTISVRQQNLQLLKQQALAISSPGSGQYGKFMSEAAIRTLTEPRDEDRRVVTQWLAENGVAHHVENELIVVSTDVAHVEALLRTEIIEVSHADLGKKLIIRGEYALPDEVRPAIATIFGLRGLPLPRKPAIELGFLPDETVEKVTPSVLASTYSISGVSVQRGSKYAQAVAEFQKQYMNATDLATYFSKEVPSAQPGDETVSKYVGVPYQEGASLEAELDVQFMMGVSPGVATEFWEWPSMDFCSDLLNFTDTLLRSQVSVMSISYGWQGSLSYIGCGDAEVDTIDSNWAKLAAKGVSVMIASGDSGSGYQTDDTCGQAKHVTIKGEKLETVPGWKASHKHYCCNTFKGKIFHDHPGVAWSFVPVSGGGYPQGTGNCTLWSTVSGTEPAGSDSIGGDFTSKVTLYPSWPASSPWVTSVGATRFVGHQVGNEEMASDQFGTGGGFSSQFNQSDAPWQVDAVAAYVAQGPSLAKFPNASLFPVHGRATPDVSALGEGYQVYVKGKVQSVYGTSASAPAFAAMVSLLNAARLQAGKPVMGFLNPFLYQNADAFTDVTKGTNAIGRGTGPVPIGYAASKGWDAATGLGTPIFKKLLAAALATA